MSNKAAWIKEEKANLTIDAADLPTPGPNELLVKNAAIGLNPVEAKVQKLAILPLSYPYILGMSFAGTVAKVGSSVTAFKPGDRVAVKRSIVDQKPNTGAFQQYVLANPNTTAKLEDQTSFVAGASAISNLATAVAALNLFLKLDRPTPAGANPANKAKKVLIYGGSTNCGGFAVNFAVGAGYTVVTTSSPHNSAFVSSLGPAKVVDHTQSVDSIAAELKAAGPYDAIFDAVGLPVATEAISQVLKEKGGSFYTVLPLFVPMELPGNVERKMESFPSAMEEPENEELRKWFFGQYGAFLATENAQKLVAPEKIELIPGELEGIQAGLDKLMKGVSGKKLVVEL